VIALITYWSMNDFPDLAKFLTEAKKTEVMRHFKVER
jgi:hypothetical protein